MIGIFAHYQKPAAAGLVRNLADEFRQAGGDFCVEEETARVAGLPAGERLEKMVERVDVLVVLGGDGTILRLMHRLGPDVPPVFGINIGALGFLTCYGQEECGEAVRSILAKDYEVRLRSLLDVQEGDKPALAALNDVVVSRGARSQLVKIRVSVNGDYLTDYNADGLIVATPTGSTAYSLAAGGPILMPDSGCFVISPICPHVLTNRSVVVSDKSLIEIERLHSEDTILVSVDGRELPNSETGEPLRITASSKKFPLVMLPGRTFSDVLRQKLKWAGAVI
ncbi:MAG: NAD(+)/NADH kinase [Chthoniobacterales bacterium]